MFKCAGIKFPSSIIPVLFALLDAQIAYLVTGVSYVWLPGQEELSSEVNNGLISPDVPQIGMRSASIVSEHW